MRIRSGFVPRRLYAAVACCAMFAAFGARLPGRRSEARPADQPRDVVRKPRPYIFGAQFCVDCHGHPENYEDRADEMMCKMDEFNIWHASDRHEYAFHWPMNVPQGRPKAKDERHTNGEQFLLLAGERAREIAVRLGIKDVRKSTCVACHAVAVPENVTAERFVQRTDGVTCVACHGAFQDWALRHQAVQDPEWRKVTRKQKEDEFGMMDLWNPVTRATKCLSCHLGNAAEGKVITHAMFAAGHPPLAGIEVAAFSDLEPRHWRYMREKPQAIQKVLGFNPHRLEQTELVVISGIVTLRESMKLFVSQYGVHGADENARTGWAEFARFDCYACHHELQTSGPLAGPSARAKSGSSGRPATPYWWRALVGLGVEAANPQAAPQRLAQLESMLGEFHDGVLAQPFGDRRKASAAAAAIIQWIKPILEELEAMTEVTEGAPGAVIDRKVAVGLLRRLCHMVRETSLDYDSVRQVSWAFQTIYREVVPNPPAHVRDVWKTLDSELGLALVGNASAVAAAPGGVVQKPPIMQSLAARLKVVADFRFESVRKHFAALETSLPEQ